MGKKNKPSRFTAKTADRHELYQLSVQAADVEVEFLDKVFKQQRKRKPFSMREDFCGTAMLTCAWVTSHKKRTAMGVDIDPQVLAWSIDHNLTPLAEPGKRITLLEQDVRVVSEMKFDIINAFNFSYWIFKSRADLREYFITVHQSLVSDGIFMLDLYGGWEAHQPMRSKRSINGRFDYVWEQAEFDPITHSVVNHIHFEFKDGSRMKKAFTYEWRFWSLLEVHELLLIAGFSKVIVYWQRDGQYKTCDSCANQPLWLAYLVALV